MFPITGKTFSALFHNRGRSQILATGKLRLDDEWRTFRIKDISATGLKGIGIIDLPCDLNVEVQIKDHEPIAAKVVWSEDRMFGLLFTFPINPHDYRTTVSGTYAMPRKPVARRRPV